MQVDVLSKFMKTVPLCQKMLTILQSILDLVKIILDIYLISLDDSVCKCWTKVSLFFVTKKFYDLT